MHFRFLGGVNWLSYTGRQVKCYKIYYFLVHKVVIVINTSDVCQKNPFLIHYKQHFNLCFKYFLMNLAILAGT